VLQLVTTFRPLLHVFDPFTLSTAETPASESKMTAPYPGEGSFEIIVQYGVQITEMSRVTDIDADVFETDCKIVNVASVHWQSW